VGKEGSSSAIVGREGGGRAGAPTEERRVMMVTVIAFPSASRWTFFVSFQALPFLNLTPIGRENTHPHFSHVPPVNQIEVMLHEEPQIIQAAQELLIEAQSLLALLPVV
jgi:hypothetical protein